MFEEALQRNQIEFVKLFLDHDFSLTDVFRDNDKLPLLYEHTLDEVNRSTEVSVIPSSFFFVAL